MADQMMSSDVLFSPVNFIGRQSQLAQLEHWYMKNAPIASILGPPGIGKTWLIRQWASKKINEGIQVHYIDAGYGISASTDDPDENTEYISQAISFKLGHQLSEEIERPIELASRVRQSGSILILDRLESCLHKQRPKSNIPIGRPTKFLANFLRAFVTLSHGEGRIIIVSNVRPADIIEEQYIEQEYLTAISSEETRDALQLGGFTQIETIQYIRSKGSEIQDLPSEDELLEAHRRLGGHPKGLGFFLGLSSADRQRFLSSSTVNQALDASLKQLFNYSVGYCTDTEKSVLVLVSLLRIPQNEEFIGRALHSSLEINLAIDDLRRRSLIEYGTLQQIGFSAHGIVKEFVKAAFKDRLKSTHLAIAQQLESLANDMQSEKTFDSLQILVEAAYHFKSAGEDHKAVLWRNASTKLALEIGKEAYLAGNHQLARDTANTLIEADLTRSEASPYILSLMHFYRAQNQHRIDFNWTLETQDLLKALELNPLNKMALSYSANVVSKAIQRHIPWHQVEGSLKQFINYARSVEMPDNQLKSIPIQLIKLLCIVTNNAADENSLWGAYDKLSLIAKEINSRQLSQGVLSEAETLALLLLYQVLRKRASNPEVAREYIARSIEVSVGALSQNKSSAQIWLKYIEAMYYGAEYSPKLEERRKFSEETVSLLLEMKDHVSPAAGYVRLLSEAVVRQSYVSERINALAQIQTTLANIRSLTDSPAAIGISEEEIDAAKIRLFLRAAKLEPEKHYEHSQNAIKLIEPYLRQPEKWLSVELAELAVHIISNITEEDSESEYMDVANNRTQKRFVINKNDIRLLDAKLDRAQQIAPASKFELLKLSLRVEYLRKNWQLNNPDEPIANVKEAEKLADSLLQTKAYTNHLFVIISELYRIIATRTFSELKHKDAIDKAIRIFNLWEQTAPTDRSKALYQNAKFLRGILEYRGARQKLNEYLKQEKLPHMRFFASRFFLDVVAHSINWDYIKNPQSDKSLKKDALAAYELFHQYLDYMGLEHEDIEDPRSAVRELFLIRIASFLGIYKSDLTWLKNAYGQLQITSSKKQGGSIASAQIIGEWSDHPDRIAQILGTHWEKAQIWREVGTLLSIILYSPNHSQLDYSAYFWRISAIIPEVVPSQEYTRQKPGQLSRFNMVRALLMYPEGSDLQKKGEEILDELYGEQKMPWVYWQFIKDLWNKTHERDEFIENSKSVASKKRARKFDVFMSHSSFDKEWVIKLKSALELRGITVWLDRDQILPGDRFIQELEKGLKASRCVVLVVSPEALNSKWVRDEYDSTINQLNSGSQNVRLIPVLLRKAKLPSFLSNRQCVDFSNEEQFEDNIAVLINGIKAKKRNPAR